MGCSLAVGDFVYSAVAGVAVVIITRRPASAAIRSVPSSAHTGGRHRGGLHRERSALLQSERGTPRRTFFLFFFCFLLFLLVVIGLSF